VLPSQLEIPACDESKCVTLKDVLIRIGDKWSLYVVVNLYNETLRFNELKRRIDGISQRMLTITVRGLERDGLLTRTVYPTNPPSVTYSLTSMGDSLLEPVIGLVRWAGSHRTEITEARERYDSLLG
jgi:DNA-binding HxlR family transcriptional regulator